MKDQSKTKQSLIQELTSLREKITELEKSEAARKKAEETLRESEEKLHLIVNTIPHIVSILDMNLHCTYLSPSCQHLLGYTQDEALALNLDQLITPESLEIATKAYEEDLELENAPDFTGHHVRVLELNAYHKNGSVIPFENTITFLRDTNGVPIGIVILSTDISKRKRSEEDLRKSEAQLRTIIEGTQASLVRVNVDGRFNYANDAMAKALGYKTAAEIIGMPYLHFIHPDDRQRVMNTYLHQVETRQPSTTQEFRIVSTEGRVMWLSFLSSLVFKDGQVVGQTGVAQNITERKQAEEALRESEDKYKFLVENINDIIWVFDLKTMSYSFCSNSVERILGYTVDETVGMKLDDIFSKESQKILQAAFGRIIAGKEPSGRILIEVEHIAKNGSRLWMEINAVLKRDKLGNPVAFNGVTRDITERKQVEAALRQSEEKFRQIVNSIPNVVAILDMNLRFTYVSASVQRILGYTPEEAMTMTLDQVCTPESLAIALKSIQERLEANAKVPDPNYVLILELEEYRKNGSTVFLENTTTFLRDANGVPIGILCVSADITERMRAEEALRESEEKYRLLTENSNDVIWTTDTELRYTYYSPSVRKLRGLEPEEAVKKTLAETVTPASLNRIISMYKHFLPDIEQGLNPTAVMEVEQYRKDGSTVWVEISVTTMRDERGRLTGLVGATRDISARKLAEDELQLRNILLSTQQEVSIDGILVVDENGTIISFNRRFVEIWAIPKDVVESKSDERALHSVMGNLVDPDEFIAKVRHLYENRSETSRDEIALKDGRILDRYSAPMLGDDGKYYGRIWYFRDITKRKRSEQALYESERRLADIINFLPIATMVIDREGKITAWNQAMEEITGVKRENMIGKGDYEYAIPFYGKRSPILIDWVFDTDKEIETHYTNLHYEKGVLSAESYIPNLGIILVGYASKLQDAAGNVVGAIESVRDVTDIRRVEAELKEAEKKYRTILETMDSGYYEVDLKGNVLYFNPALRKFLGYGKQEMKSVNFTDWVDPEEVDRVYGIFKEVRRSGEPNVDFYVRVSRKNGEKAYSAVSAFPMRDDHGDIVGFSGTVRDITALKEAKDAADAANQSKSIFLANMSHEIRTPMNAILGFAQLIERDPQLSPRSREHLEIINHSGEHLMALINDILEMSKIEAGRATFVQNTFDLHALLRDIERMFHVRTDAKNLRFLLEMVGTVPRWVFTDEGKLRQVLINLLGNAVKFTREGGIALRLSAKAGKGDTLDLQFEVEDTGPGMSEEEIGHLFQAFEQTQTGIQTGGTGLGLSLSRGFVQIMGGSISVASTVGKGTIFRFEIPVREGTEEQTLSKEAKRRILRLSPGQGDIRVLIADDRETNRQLLSRLLGTVGFQVREVVNGVEAVRMVHEWKPQVVLMDMTMPVMDGYEATRKIKESPDIKDTAIVAVTASAFEEDKQRVFAAGADAYLSKPFKDADLFENIGRLTGAKYLYEETGSAKASETIDDKIQLHKIVASLPPDFVNRMRNAVESADLDLLNEFAGQLVTDHPTLAKWIQEMATRYEYESLIEIFSKGV